MKKILLLSVAFTVFYVLQTSLAEGQILYNYALGGDVSDFPSRSVVRTVSDQKVIASYWDGTNYRLARVGLTDIISAKMDDHHQIADIRIVGDDIFFCGMDRSNNRAFLGHATVSDIEAQNPHIQFQELIIPVALSRLYRLAAYQESPTDPFRLVAVGDIWYNGTPDPNIYPCPASPYMTDCCAHIVVEYKYQSGSFTHLGNKVLNDVNGHFEYACDVVETDNYVAVVTFPAADELIIHRCDKSNVLGPLSFNYYYRYTVPSGRVVFNACKMKGDTIAVASVFDYGGGVDDMQVRVVDLATMNMPYAQVFDLMDKDDVYEMAYLPDVQKLVLLTNQTYSYLVELHHTFCFLKPYETVFPYNMEKIYESNDRSFTSVDRLSSQHIVAAGGNYWMMRDVTYNNPTSTCYVTKDHPVRWLKLSSPISDKYVFLPLNITHSFSSCNETYEQIWMTGKCVIP